MPSTRRPVLTLLVAFLCVQAASAQVAPRQYREYVYFGGQLLTYDSNFADVLPDNAFYPFVAKIANLGITGGCGGPNFCPDAPVTREQMAPFLHEGCG